MKRMYLGLLILFAVGVLACGPQSTNNTATPNANASASPKPSPKLGNPSGDDLSNFGEMLVTITIADDDQKHPFIESVVPDPADLTGGLRVQWLVINNSTAASGQDATLEIGPFKGTANPADNKPFGPDSCANNFKLDFLKEGKESREISEQSQFQSGERAYNYDVTLRAADGTELAKFKKLPEIIVSGMVLKPEASPKATPKPPPPAKPIK